MIAISGDTVDCPGLEALARGADVLVHCCYMARAEIEDEQLLISTARQHFSGRIVVGEDLMQIDVP